MSAPAFAPGPWVTDPEVEHEMVLDANGVLVADCSIVHRNRTTSQCVAHAHLIAAALSLYGALAALLPAVDSEIEQRKFSGNDEDWAELERLSSAAHAALAAAKGERT